MPTPRTDHLPWRGDPAEIVTEQINPTPALTAWLEALHPDWHAEAACVDTPTSWWFPTRGERTDQAKAICAGCAVKTECLAAALDRGEKFGIWGGTSERERRRLRAGAA